MLPADALGVLNASNEHDAGRKRGAAHFHDERSLSTHPNATPVQ
jgi:hypothetical protein